MNTKYFKRITYLSLGHSQCKHNAPRTGRHVCEAAEEETEKPPLRVLLRPGGSQLPAASLCLSSISALQLLSSRLRFRTTPKKILSFPFKGT